MEEDFYKFSKEVNIPVEIFLSPDKMGGDYKNNIMKVLRDKYEKNCIADWGYILKINKLVRMISDEIGNITPAVKMLIEVNMTVIMPEVGMDFTMGIDIIFTHGIFIHRDKVRILMPIASMEGWTVIKDFTSQKLVHTKTNAVLKTNDKIHIRLVNVRFEKDGYSCIGEFFSQ